MAYNSCMSSPQRMKRAPRSTRMCRESCHQSNALSLLVVQCHSANLDIEKVLIYTAITEKDSITHYSGGRGNRSRKYLLHQSCFSHILLTLQDVPCPALACRSALPGIRGNITSTQHPLKAGEFLTSSRVYLRIPSFNYRDVWFYDLVIDISQSKTA